MTRPLHSQPAHAARLLLLALLGSLLAACTSTEVAVQGEFPTAVVERLPVRLGVYYDPAFSTHSHVEEIPDIGEYTIDTGAANRRLFDAILPSMFEAVVAVDAPDAAMAAGVDAVLVPKVDDFQFAVPLQTKTAFSEVWIRYQFELYAADGELIASWPLTAYGKVPTGAMRSQEGALNAAAIQALRDGGAFFAIRFQETPGVREWLALRQNPVAPQ